MLAKGVANAYPSRSSKKCTPFAGSDASECMKFDKELLAKGVSFVDYSERFPRHLCISSEDVLAFQKKLDTYKEAFEEELETFKDQILYLTLSIHHLEQKNKALTKENKILKNAYCDSKDPEEL